MRSRLDNTPASDGRTIVQPGRRAARRRIGMTLIEMLVAIGVLAVMILAVSQILVQTQRFISAAQASRRSHSMAFTIARVIRRDLRRASKDGFFYIQNNKMAFTTAGPITGISASVKEGGVNKAVKGDGSIIVYGGQECASTIGSSRQTYLWRPEFICYCTDGSPSATIDGERVNTDFSAIQRTDANSSLLQQLATAAVSKVPNDSELKLPPATATHLENLWQVLVPSVSNVQIYWTDGTTSGGAMRWRSDGHLWSHVDSANWAWPKAVRIRFKINDPSMPAELRGRFYEVICNVGGE